MNAPNVNAPTAMPTAVPTYGPTGLPSSLPTGVPTYAPTALPTSLGTAKLSVKRKVAAVEDQVAAINISKLAFPSGENEIHELVLTAPYGVLSDVSVVGHFPMAPTSTPTTPEASLPVNVPFISAV